MQMLHKVKQMYSIFLDFFMSKIILLDSIRSMQNVGAMFRNADGAGFEKVILTGYSPVPPRKDISKTAIGAQNWIDWEYFVDPVEIVLSLKKEGYTIYSVELGETAIDYRELFQMPKENVCLIMGNEIDGVSARLLELSDEIVFIPMRGKKESLNVSVAAGIVMYAV
jgi:tRNA G18 (ribose-2'-O)-methylase SpoU